MSQYWSLQAVGCGQVLVSKWQPPGELTPINIPWGLSTSLLDPSVSHSQLLSPQEIFQGPQASPVQALVESEVCAESQCMSNFVCTLQEWSLCFPLSCVTSVLKPHWPSMPNALGSPPPNARLSGWGA